MSDELIIESKDGIGYLRFNRAEKHNAISYAMWQGIARAADAFASDEDVRVVVVTGEGGRAFSSGADISQFEKQRATADAIEVYNAAIDQALQRLGTLAKPTIARIQGYCVGGGVGIALSCDLRIASDDSRFAIPAARLGLAYGFDALRRLTEIVGSSRAKEILFTAQRFSASEAYDMGLVNRVLPAGDLDAFVDDYARNIATNAPLTLKASKQMIDEIGVDPDDRDLELCQRLFDACFASEDYKEGRQAFLEEREPRFRGR